MPDTPDPSKDAAASFASDLPLGMPATRKLSAQDLELVALVMLADEEAFGSRLAERIERLSNGFYRPSPGMLYPVLSRLGERGLVARRRQGRRKYYRLTSEGRIHLDTHLEQARRVEARLASAGRKFGALFAAMNRTLDDEDTALPLAQEMLEARMDLKAALHESRHASSETQRRILGLLQDTTERIRLEVREAP